MVLLSFGSCELAMDVYERGTEKVSEQRKQTLFAPDKHQVAVDLVTADIRVRRILRKIANDSSE